MRYKFLLFDLDDTLLDFKANEAVSLKKLFEGHGCSFSEEILRLYHAVNSRLWCDYEKGLIPLEKVLSSRFFDTMEKLGTKIDGMEWENEYRELLGNGSQIVEGAFELCQKLSLTHRLFVITNGVSETQQKRLKLSGLHDYFESIFDSQSIGFQKPFKEYFDYVAESIEGFDKKRALIIGDSLQTDIKGGLISGIDTCWLNRESSKKAAEIPSTYTVTSLAEVHGICVQ